jgi:CheY-like chemotaxis protein
LVTGPGQPGPTAGGLLHAPSEQQALTAAILRDKYLHDPEPQRWDMNLNSRSVRMADEIADKVRLGAHIQEVLGGEVERIAGSKAAVDSLRIKYSIRASHGGRRVCDGEAVLKADPALAHIPVVVLTTSEAEKDVARAYYNHANSYLVKPVGFEEFKRLMDDLGFYWLGWNTQPEI